jgi:tetratricopeptide (TPR) repeat protein
MYHNLDPVFPPNYYRMAHIYLMRRQWDRAIATYQDFLEARQCFVDPSLAAKPFLRRTILDYQGYVQEDGLWKHKHETAEAYTNLGNAYFMAGDLSHAEKTYKKALTLEPNNPTVLRNLQILYGRAQTPEQPKVPLPAAEPKNLNPLELVPTPSK